MGYQNDQEQVIKTLYGVPIEGSHDTPKKGAGNSMVSPQILKILLRQQRTIKEEGKNRHIRPQHYQEARENSLKNDPSSIEKRLRS